MADPEVARTLSPIEITEFKGLLRSNPARTAIICGLLALQEEGVDFPEDSDFDDMRTRGRLSVDLSERVDLDCHDPTKAIMRAAEIAQELQLSLRMRGEAWNHQEGALPPEAFRAKFDALEQLEQLDVGAAELYG